MTIGDRVKEVRKHLKMNQTQFAERIEFTHPSAVSKLELGENNVQERTLKLICTEFGVNYGYLKYGHEPMFEPRESRDLENIERIMYGDNEYVKSVFRELAAMPPEWWEQAVALLDRISAHKKEGR